MIAGCSHRIATFLQIAKETGARRSEIHALQWVDVDAARNVITINNPKENCNPRQIKVSSKVIAMINQLPKTSEKLFDTTLKAIDACFCRYRKKIAYKLNNSRIRKIGFHTLRHFKGTMLYHKTKDIQFVKQVLGHKNISSTLIYTQLVSFESDEWNSAVANTVNEARQLIEAGFEYVCEMEGVKLFRKRK